jgi:uncharacterized damage-inducible protein DinB
MPETANRAHAAAARLQSAVAEMLADVDRLPAELITWRPADDVWSVMDNLCHVQEFVPYWTAQALQAIRHPDQLWGRDHSNTDRLAAVTNTAARRLADVERAIRDVAREAADAIRQLSDADLDVEATSKNPRWGRKPAFFILDHLVVQHVEKHLGQIRRNVQQFQQEKASAP